jgi:serine/threonine protein kinase
VSGEGQAPARLGPYEIVRRIAFGGMGEVFLAKRSGADGFSKEVVVKRLLDQHVENEEFVAMFRDEARLTAQLHHGNIVQLIEFGESDGHYYLVLEYVNGPSLRTVLKELNKRGDRLSIPEAALIAIEVARALDYAHAKVGDDGRPLMIVHRDVTPSNILISYEGVVKLTDFGIARARERLSPTNAGHIKGKFGYLAPETVRDGTSDARSDLHSFGAVIFETLTGRPAFRADSDAQTLHRILNETVPPPSRFNPAVPPELDDVVGSLLAREPSERPRRGNDVVEVLGPLCYPSIPPATELLARTLGRLFKSGAEQTTAEVPTPNITASHKGARVLVVEESRTLRALMKATIGTRYAVFEASNVAEAKAILANGPRPNAVLCQRSLEGASGLDLCRFIRTHPSYADIPFVLLASDVSAEFSSEAIAAGVQAVLPKRYDPTRLLETLSEVLGRPVTSPR